MIELYCILIRTGRRTLVQVPERYRAEVAARL